MTAAARHQRVIQYERPWIYPEQERFLFAPERFSLCEASTKTGKTAGCLIWLTEQGCLVGSRGREFWWVAPIYRQADIAFERFKLYAPRAMYRPNDSMRTNRLPNGAVLRFLSGEKPDHLYGEDVWAAVVDEASRLREEAYHAIRSTLTVTQGPLRIVGNVKGRKNWFFKLCRMAQGGAPGMAYLKLTVYHAIQAGLVAPDEVEHARRTLPELVFLELYMAQPQDDISNPFGAETLENSYQATLAPGPVVCWGGDLGKTLDFTVLVGLNAFGRTAAYYRFQRPWAETIQFIREKVGQAPGFIDSSGVGDPIVEFLTRTIALGEASLNPEAVQDAMRRVAAAGQVDRQADDAQAHLLAACSNLRGFKFTGTSKQSLLESYALSLQQSEIGLYEDPKGAVRAEHEAFEYELTRTGVRYCAPEGMHDDTVMAYALASHARRLATYNFSHGGAVVHLG